MSGSRHFGFVQPIYPAEVGTSADTNINGYMHSNFANTVRLTSLLVTDENGTPISGVTVTSSEGNIYPWQPPIRVQSLRGSRCRVSPRSFS